MAEKLRVTDVRDAITYPVGASLERVREAGGVGALIDVETEELGGRERLAELQRRSTRPDFTEDEQRELDALAEAVAAVAASVETKTVESGGDCSDVPEESLAWLLDRGWVERVEDVVTSLSADDAIELVRSTDDVGALDQIEAEESENKQRVTVLRAIEERRSALEESDS